MAIAATAASTIGTTLGYYGGLFDLLFQRLIDIIQGLPGLIFIIFVVSIVGASTGAIIVALGVLFAAGSSRIVRAQVISVAQNDYVVAARSIGASDLRILLRHIYPNLFAVVIVSISRADRVRDPDRVDALVPSASGFRRRSRPGGACCRTRSRK